MPCPHSSRQRYAALRQGCTKTPEWVYQFHRNGCTKTSGAVTLLGTALGPVLCHRLREPLCRRRDRGVARVTPDTSAKLLQLGPEAGDPLGLLLDQLLLDGDELGELLIGRRTGLVGTFWHACKSSNIGVISRTRWSTACDGAAEGLNGYSRVRSLTQDDSHAFVRPDQIKDEFRSIIGMVKQMYTVLDMPLIVDLSFRGEEERNVS